MLQGAGLWPVVRTFTTLPTLHVRPTAGLCAWVINIVSFYNVFCEVEPKRLALESANQQLQSAQDKLRHIQSKISSLEQALSTLKAEFEQATSDKLKCQQEVSKSLSAFRPFQIIWRKKPLVPSCLVESEH